MVIDRFAPELKGRLDIHSAAYGNCSCGHAWITLDTKVIANFCTRAKYIAEGHESGPPSVNSMYKNHLTQFGELSRQDAYEACWAFIHELSIDQAIADSDPLIQTLAIADVRMGQRRLKAIDGKNLHPLAAYFLQLRLRQNKPLNMVE